MKSLFNHDNNQAKFGDSRARGTNIGEFDYVKLCNMDEGNGFIGCIQQRNGKVRCMQPYSYLRE